MDGQGGQDRGIGIVEAAHGPLAHDQYAQHLASVGNRHAEKPMEGSGTGLADELLMRRFGNVLQVDGQGALGHPPNEPLAKAELNVSDHGRGQARRGHDHMPSALVFGEINTAGIHRHQHASALYHDPQRRLHIWRCVHFTNQPGERRQPGMLATR